MIKRVRVYMFHAKLCLEIKKYEKCIEYYEKCIPIELSILSCVTNDRLVDKIKENKLSTKWSQAIHFLCLTYHNLSICNEHVLNIQKAMEYSKVAFWHATNFLQENDDMIIAIQKNMMELQKNYGLYLKEIDEIERVVFSKLEIDEYCSEEESNSSSIDSIQNRLDKEINYNEIFLRSQYVPKIKDNVSIPASTSLFDVSSIQKSASIFKKHHSRNTSLGNVILETGKKNSPSLETTMIKTTPKSKVSRKIEFNTDYFPKALTTNNYFKSFYKTKNENETETKGMLKKFSSFLEESQNEKKRNKEKKTEVKLNDVIPEVEYCHPLMRKKSKKNESCDIDTYFENKITTSLDKNRAGHPKNMKKVNTNFFCQFKQEEFDRREFISGKSLLMLNNKEDFSSHLPINDFKIFQANRELDYHHAKNCLDAMSNARISNQYLSAKSKSFSSKQDDTLMSKSYEKSKKNLAEIIMARSDVFDLKNFVSVLKRKKIQSKMESYESIHLDPPPPEKQPFSIENIQKNVKDRIQASMIDFEKKIEQTDATFIKKKFRRSSLGAMPEFYEMKLQRKNDSIAKSTKNYHFEMQKLKKMSFSELIRLSAKISKRSKKSTQIYQRI